MRKKLLALAVFFSLISLQAKAEIIEAGPSTSGGSGTVSAGTAGQAAYYTGATTTGSTPYITIGTAGAPVTLTSPVNIGTPSITDTGVLLQATSSVAGYNQIIIQNTNSAANASSNFVVNNNLGTNSTYYGEFGMNSSGFTGSGSLNIPSAVYLDLQSGDLVVGTVSSNPIHFVVNSGTTDAMYIGTSGKVGIGTTSPQSKLHINAGEVQVGSSGASCAANVGGAIRFNGSSLLL